MEQGFKMVERVGVWLKNGRKMIKIVENSRKISQGWEAGSEMDAGVIKRV